MAKSLQSLLKKSKKYILDVMRERFRKKH